MNCRKSGIYFLTILSLFTLFSYQSSAQNSIGIQWQRTFGYGPMNKGIAIVKLPNDEFATLGAGGGYLILAKRNKLGAAIWTKFYPYSSYPVSPRSFSPTQDGGFIITGEIFECIAGYSKTDIWVMKVDAFGNQQWQACYGGTGDDVGTSVVQLSSGNYMLAAMAGSNDFNISGNHGGSDGWLAEFSPAGVMLWSRCFGGSNFDGIFDVKATSDGFIVAGSTRSVNGDLAGTGLHGEVDGFMTKFDNNRNVLWTKCFGGTSDDNLKKLIVNDAGDFFTIGMSRSADGDISGNHGAEDVWIVKVNSSGTLLWQRPLGGSGIDDGLSLDLCPDGDLAISGFSGSLDGDMHSNYYAHKCFVAKISPITGQVKARALLAGIDVFESIEGVTVSSEGGILAFGSVMRNNPYVTNYVGGTSYETNIWLLKLGAFNTIKGNIYLDKNLNGIKETNEPFFDEGLLTVKKAGATDSVRLNAFGGHFITNTDTGNFETRFTPYLPYYTIEPSTKSTVFTSYYNSDSFAIRLLPIPGKRDLKLSMVDLIGARGGRETAIKINYRNVGTETVTATLKFVKDPKTDFASAVPAITTIQQDTIIWNLGVLHPLDSGSVKINLYVKPPPLNNIGSLLNYSVSIVHDDVDETPVDNRQRLRQVVIGSFDPNDKRELSTTGKIKTSEITSGEYLNYMIRFQNTGNDTAYKIVILDTLQSKLDVSTLEMTGASHKYSLAVLNNGVLRWTFDDIKLVDSIHNEPLSHGYISFRIRPTNTVVPGDTLKNNCSIYFDFNLPVKTNTALVIVEQAVLPVHLTTFNAVWRQAQAELQWKTSFEKNTAWFEIERSNTGNDFVTVGKIAASNKDAGSTYSFIDKPINNGRIYYRLKIVDIDGTVRYSEIVVLDVKSSVNVVLNVSPNPAGTGNLKINLAGEINGNVHIRFIDALGKVLVKKDYNSQRIDGFETVMPLKNLQKGNYFLVVTVNERTLQKLIIVQ